MTISVNYVGDQSHFVNTGANARGYWANQLNPIYLAGLGGVTDSTGTKPILIAAATSANVAKAQAAMARRRHPGVLPERRECKSEQLRADDRPGPRQHSRNTAASTDLWGANTANLTYHSFQLMVLQRTAHGLSFNINYTYSKNIGDDGTFRSGFDIPAAAISGGGQSWHQDRIERSWTIVSAPQVAPCLRRLSASLRQGSARRQLHAGCVRLPADGRSPASTPMVPVRQSPSSPACAAPPTFPSRVSACRTWCPAQPTPASTEATARLRRNQRMQYRDRTRLHRGQLR